MVALVHVYNLLSALNVQQTNFLYSSLFSLRFESLRALSSRGGAMPPPPLYMPLVETLRYGEDDMSYLV